MITPIGINNNTKTYRPITFKAHPDFEKLVRNYDVTASSFFRRGPYYGSTSEEFVDVEKILSSVFQSLGEPKTMLIAGIGDSQEPFSYLAVIKSLLKDTPLSKVLDLHTVDLQSRPAAKKLRADSFFNSSWEPEFAKSSFVKDDPEKYGAYSYQRYRVTNEIYEYLNSVYNNIRRGIWEARVQDAIKKYPNDSFDVVSINNTLGYIRESDEILSTFQHVYRVLKPEGVFITDPFKLNSLERSGILENMTEIFDGIYKKNP